MLCQVFQDPSLVNGVEPNIILLSQYQVGTGFSKKVIGVLMKRLTGMAMAKSPFVERPNGHTHSHWVKPELVAEVRFTEWTRDGKMRHPAFLGLRDDKMATECEREVPL